jgi:predicted ABC-type ATPase
MAKKLLIFAGPNGSGKSTLYRKLQAKYASLANLPLINPDDIAKAFFGNFLPDGTKESNRQMLVAGKEALTQRKNLIAQNKSFGFETTLSGNSEKHTIKKALDAGYELYIIYVALDDPFLNVQRVKARVKNKGHFVEPSIVVRRYYKSMQNLNEIIPLAKSVYLFDNTFSKFRLIASLRESGARKENSVIVKNTLPKWSNDAITTLIERMKS